MLLGSKPLQYRNLIVKSLKLSVHDSSLFIVPRRYTACACRGISLPKVQLRQQNLDCLFKLSFSLEPLNIIDDGFDAT
ncbi:hypothetical protein WN73_38435 [Bradyrhizobium sp. CCBAU 45394]|nr:hypothetical protein [Bradyrhizobium sp. CCBAU 45394]